MGNLKKARSIFLRKLAVTLRDIKRDAVAGAFKVIAGGGFFLEGVDQTLRPSGEFEASLVDGEFFVVEWHEEREKEEVEED